jgi:cyanophycin synthetase
MLPWLGGRSICLTSLQRKPEELRALVKTHVKIVYLDLWQAEDWIMFDDQDKRTPIIAVNDIPATFNGRASHNVSNIMHAVAAAMALGFRLENIRKTLAAFAMGFEVLPGRLNMHHNGRIQIIMDNAHNADGLAQLVKFTDQLPCSGRRILRFGVSTKASVAAAFRAASAAAGHFDHYICSDLPRNTPTDSSHLTEGLKQGLLANGVAPESIEVFTDPERSVEYPVSLCQPGDLLVLVTSTATLASTWQKILNT